VRISVIIPALNEEKRLPGLLRSLSGKGLEIIVADGGSLDDTLAIARSFTPLVTVSPPGRGTQMARGARLAKGDVLLFLHADTLLPENFPYLVERALSKPGAVFGAFKLDIRPVSPSLRLICLGANLRTRLFSLPYGDQALFMTHAAFGAVGGFPDQPLMEDIELSARLKRLSPPACLRARVRTSGRRWETRGVWRTVLLMWRLRLAYWRGVPAARLAERYR